MNLPERFFPPPWTAAVVLLCASACINVPGIESAETEVRMTSPAETAYTNGALELRLAVTGHAPDRVELLKNGEVLAELAPPYVYTWDTTGEAEGTYRLEARAVLGDTAFVSPSRDVVVDRTPPQVVSRFPEPGAQEVWVQSPIRAEFSEPMKRSTVTTESVHLRVGELAVAHTVSLSEDGRTVTVTPVTALTAPSTVELSVTGVLTDLAGNAAVDLGAAWGWVVPEFVPYPSFQPNSEAAPSGITPRIRLDANGHPTVLTLQHHDSGPNLFVTRWTGSRWQQLGGGLKTSSTDYSVRSPDIQLSPDGTPIVAWQEDLGAEFNNYIHVARWTGATWERLGGSEGILPERPHAWGVSLQIDANGNPVVAIDMDPEDVDGNAVHVYQWSTGQWQRIGAALHGAPQYRVRTPALAMDLNGHPVVAFAQDDNNAGRILVWRWTGMTWEQLGTAANTSPHIKSIYRIHISITSSNQPVISWSGRVPTTYKDDIFYSQWTSSQWVPLGAPQHQDSTNDRAAHETYSAPGDKLLALSSEHTSSGTQISLDCRTNEQWNNIWSTRNLPSGTMHRGISSSMAADTHGNIALAWPANRDGHWDVVVYRRNQ